MNHKVILKLQDPDGFISEITDFVIRSQNEIMKETFLITENLTIMIPKYILEVLCAQITRPVLKRGKSRFMNMIIQYSPDHSITIFHEDFIYYKFEPKKLDVSGFIIKNDSK